MKPDKPNRPMANIKPGSRIDHVDNRQAEKEFDFNEDAFNNADTLRLVALLHHDELALEESSTGNTTEAFDPYNSKLKWADNKPRKSIDDLRKLSDQITRERRAARKPTGRK